MKKNFGFVGIIAVLASLLFASTSQAGVGGIRCYLQKGEVVISVQADSADHLTTLTAGLANEGWTKIDTGVPNATIHYGTGVFPHHSDKPVPIARLVRDARKNGDYEVALHEAKWAARLTAQIESK